MSAVFVDDELNARALLNLIAIFCLSGTSSSSSSSKKLPVGYRAEEVDDVLFLPFMYGESDERAIVSPDHRDDGGVDAFDTGAEDRKDNMIGSSRMGDGRRGRLLDRYAPVLSGLITTEGSNRVGVQDSARGPFDVGNDAFRGLFGFVGAPAWAGLSGDPVLHKQLLRALGDWRDTGNCIEVGKREYVGVCGHGRFGRALSLFAGWVAGVAPE